MFIIWRRRLILQGYYLQDKYKHIARKDNVVADALSKEGFLDWNGEIL